MSIIIFLLLNLHVFYLLYLLRFEHTCKTRNGTEYQFCGKLTNARKTEADIYLHAENNKKFVVDL